MKKETRKLFAMADTRGNKSKLTGHSIDLRRWFLPITVLALAITVLQQAPDQVEAQADNRTERFARAPITGKLIPRVAPSRLHEARSEQEMTVVLKLAGDPVALVRSRAPGKRIA
jgi:hypothetical protein